MKTASNNEIKLLRKLRQKKYRDREKMFIAEGERTVLQILENHLVEVEKIFIKEDQVIELQDDVSLAVLPDEIFDEVADTETPQGIMALCKIPEETEITALQNENGIIVATDAIQDPGNLGTIIRTAAWFGVKALITGKGTVDVYHPKVVRSTAGATGSIPVFSGELQQLLPELEASGWKIVLLAGGADSTNMDEFHHTGKIVVVVGNEANGVSQELMKKYDSIRIDSAASVTPVESLNAAIATGIALHALSQQ